MNLLRIDQFQWLKEEIMLVIIAKIQIKPEFRGRFMESMLDDARGSVENEPGCLHFSVVEDGEDPNRIYLFEVYRDQADFAAHQQTPHYLRWRDTVKDWFAAPTEVIRGRNVYPPNEAWKKQAQSLPSGLAEE